MALMGIQEYIVKDVNNIAWVEFWVLLCVYISKNWHLKTLVKVWLHGQN